MGAIYDLAGDAEARDIQRQAQMQQALQAFGTFMQKNKEMKQNAPLIQIQTMNQQAEALMNQLKAQRALQFMQKQGGVQPQMQQPQFGGISSQPSLTMPSPSGGAPQFLSPQQLMAQNQMGGFQGQQTQPTGQKQYSIQDIVEPERDPFTNELTGLGLQQQAQNDLIKKELEAEQKLKVPTSKMREDYNSTLEQLNAFQELRKEAEAAPSAWPSIGAKILGFFTRGADIEGLEKVPGMGFASKIEEEKIYSDNRPAMATSLYKALTGDTRLSDFDSKRALSLTWSTSEASNIRKKKFDKIERMLKARANLIQQGRYSLNKEGDFVTPLNAIEAEAQKIELSEMSDEELMKIASGS